MFTVQFAGKNNSQKLYLHLSESKKRTFQVFRQEVTREKEAAVDINWNTKERNIRKSSHFSGKVLDVARKKVQKDHSQKKRGTNLTSW